jgi:hypothetical protein
MRRAGCAARSAGVSSAEEGAVPLAPTLLAARLLPLAEESAALLTPALLAAEKESATPLTPTPLTPEEGTAPLLPEKESAAAGHRVHTRCCCRLCSRRAPPIALRGRGRA